MSAGPLPAPCGNAQCLGGKTHACDSPGWQTPHYTQSSPERDEESSDVIGCADRSRDIAEISRFFGIVIKMFFSDHAPPPFHAEYVEHQR